MLSPTLFIIFLGSQKGTFCVGDTVGENILGTKKGLAITS